MSDDTTFADLVRTAREARFMSQAVLAKASGVSERTVIRIERGAPASSETVQALCAVLGISATSARAAMAGQASRSAPSVEGGALQLLPEAYGEETGRERALGVRRLLREQPDVRIVTGSDGVRIAESRVPSDIATRLAPSYIGGTPYNERLLGILMRQRRTWEERVYDAIVAKTDAGIAIMVSAFVFIAAMFGVGIGLFTLLSTVAPGIVAVQAATWGMLAFMAAVGFRVVRNSGASARLEAILRESERVLGICGDRIVFGDSDDLTTIDAMKARHVTVEPDGDRHVSLRIATRDGKRFAFHALPADARIIHALDRFKTAALSADVLPEAAGLALA